MKLLLFILSVSVLSMLFIKRKKINKKVLFVSIILYLVITIPLFILKKIGIIPNNVWLVSIYASLLCFFAYIIGVVATNFIINLLIKFQIDVGNESKPLVVKLIKNKNLIQTVYCLLFYLGFIMGLYGIWFKT